jgi:hypothetical protein
LRVEVELLADVDVELIVLLWPLCVDVELLADVDVELVVYLPDLCRTSCSKKGHGKMGTGKKKSDGRVTFFKSRTVPCKMTQAAKNRGHPASTPQPTTLGAAALTGRAKAELWSSSTRAPI